MNEFESPNDTQHTAQHENSDTEKALRIVGLVMGREGYGVMRAWKGLARGFRNRNVELVVASMSSGPLEQTLANDGIPIAILDSAPPPALASQGIKKFSSLIVRLAWQLRQTRRFISLIKRERADAILFRSPMEVLLAGLAARTTSIRAYWLLPNAISDYPLDINRRIYRLAFKFLNVVPISNSHYTDTTVGPGNFERHIAHLGVDPSEFDPYSPPQMLRSELAIPSDAAILGLFARIVPSKGQVRLIEALGALGEKASGVYLIICGGPTEGIYANELRQTLERLNLAERVRWLGPISNVVDHYKLCDVIVNSRLDPEPFGFSIIEAMMLAKPVLAHKAGGPGETVIDGVTGWHIHGPDRSFFVEGLQRMLEDKPRWAQFGNAARDVALRRYTHTAMTDRILAAIRMRSTGPT